MKKSYKQALAASKPDAHDDESISVGSSGNSIAGTIEEEIRHQEDMRNALRTCGYNVDDENGEKAALREQIQRWEQLLVSVDYSFTVFTHNVNSHSL